MRAPRKGPKRRKVPKPFVRKDSALVQRTLTSALGIAAPRRKRILFKPTGGDTPLLKQTKVKVLRSAKFVDVVSHLSRQVKRAHVFVYLNDAFTPSYDEQVGRLFDWFGSGSGGEGEFETNGGSARKKKQMLVVNYSAQQAYG